MWSSSLNCYWEFFPVLYSKLTVNFVEKWEKLQEVKLMSKKGSCVWENIRNPACSWGLISNYSIHLYLAQIASFLPLCSIWSLSKRALRHGKAGKRKCCMETHWIPLSLSYFCSFVFSFISIHSRLFGKGALDSKSMSKNKHAINNLFFSSEKNPSILPTNGTPSAPWC